MRAWMRRGVLACVLFPVSLLMALVVTLRQAMYRSGYKKAERLPVPVIVVGNIFVGGTGKTPLTIWLVKALREAGFTPGVVSRGYGRDADTLIEVRATSLSGDVGDEPLLIAQRAQCPVWVGRKRVEAARALLASNPAVDVVISDDGLQHYALARDIEIVLSDQRGNGNGWLLPAGPLREFAGRVRDFNIINVGASKAVTIPMPMRLSATPTFAMQLDSGMAEQLKDRDNRKPLSTFASATRVAALAGIGSPARFFETLRAAGLVVDEYPLPDHYDFTDNPFEGLAADIFLITEKDAVKCKAIDAINNDPRIWVVPVSARIDSLFTQQIVEKLREFPIA
jgi:tetraacyldisaccharide 4'-kinase